MKSKSAHGDRHGGGSLRRLRTRAVNCATARDSRSGAGLWKKRSARFGSLQRVVQVNLIATFNVLRLAAAAMMANPPGSDDERGVIVNTASVAAFEGQIGQAAYAASKGGVAAMTLPIARELAQFGIRVAAIAPGMFATARMMTPTPDEVRASARGANAISPPPRRSGGIRPPRV